jgi:hypothetical protein
MAHQVEALPTERVGHAESVGDEEIQPVVVHVRRLCARRVAPLVGGDREVTSFGEHGQLAAPRERRLREPMEEQHQVPVLGSGDASVENERTYLQLKLALRGALAPGVVRARFLCVIARSNSAG